MQNYFLQSLFLSLFLVTSTAFAVGGGGLKGPEFTFDNFKMENLSPFYEIKYKSLGNLVDTKYNKKARDQFKHEVKKICGKDCHFEKVSHAKYTSVMNWKVTHKIYNFVFYITCDPRVIEVNMDPMTTSEIVAVKDQIQTLIFDAAKKAGLRTKNDPGNGHIHLDIRSHFGDPMKDGEAMLLRNFIVDFQNHPEIFNYGIAYGNNIITNAPTIAYHGKEYVKAFDRVIHTFDKAPQDYNMLWLAKAIINKVYKLGAVKEKEKTVGEKYQALNLSRIIYSNYDNNETIEIRALRAQRSADEYVKLLQLIDARINYLLSQKKLVPYQKKVFNIKTTFGGGFRQRTVDSFYDYVTESGLDYKEYVTLLPKGLQKRVPTKLRLK